MTDANERAAKIVGESTKRSETALPAGVEAAWDAWSAGVGEVDARTMALLRAAFEAGVEAGRIPVAAAFGRKGGLVGGKARAASLSKERRQQIAKKAAKSRWNKGTNGRADGT